MRQFSVILGLLLVASLASGVANATILKGSQVTNAGQNMMVDLTIDTTLNTVAIEMTGPEAVWFGVGFEPLTHPGGASTYSVNALGGALAPDVQEWDLGSFGPVGQLIDSLTVDSNTVSSGVRTVLLSGLQDGVNYTYPTIPKTMDIAWAYGNSPDFAIHAGRGETTLVLTEIPEPSTFLLLGIAGFGVCYSKRRR